MSLRRKVLKSIAYSLALLILGAAIWTKDFHLTILATAINSVIGLICVQID